MARQRNVNNQVFFSSDHRATSLRGNIQRGKVPDTFSMRLRVVDASVFPYIPGFFIVTPIYMIAEKASEVILMDAKRGSA